MQVLAIILGAVAMILSMANAAPVSIVSAPYGNMTAPAFDNTTAVNASFTTAAFGIKARSSTICENCMSCTAKQLGFLSIALRYNLHIGAPFRDGWGCASIKKALENGEGVPELKKSSFFCDDDGHGMTKIRFTVWQYGKGRAVSEVFNQACKAMNNDFNCPNE